MGNYYERRRYKTFLATWRPAGGVIRVVLTEQGKGWAAFFCTDPEASVADVLTAVADRAAIEQAFHDLKEVWGAGQQQLRNLWANVGAFHLNLWLHTLVEVWAWDRRPGRLIDRAAWCRFLYAMPSSSVMVPLTFGASRILPMAQTVSGGINRFSV